MVSALASLLAALLTVSGGVAPLSHSEPPSPATVVVQPESVALHTGETQQLTAVTDGPGNQANPRAVRWSTSAASVATVSRDGLVAAVAPGTATITATSMGSSGTSVVTVTPVAPPNQPPTVTITAPADGATFPSGSTVSFNATATDPEDGDLTSAIAWSIDGAALGNGGSVATSSLAAGTHTATASVTDAATATATDTVTVTVTAPPPNQVPTVSITGPSDGADIYASQTVELTATATDPEDGDLSAGVQWSLASSEGTSSAGTGGSLTVGPLALGTYTVTASVTDAGGLTATDQITIHVVSEPIVVIVTTDSTSLNESAAIGFTATVTGAVTGTVDDQLDDLATWTLSGGDGTTQDAGTGGTITVGPLAPGPYTVTATVDPGGGLSPASGQQAFTVGDCVVTAELLPASGQFIPQLLTVGTIATTTYDSCGRPLRYYWDCQSDTTPDCAAFNAAANADGNTHSIAYLQINTFDEIAIILTVCAVDPTYDPASSAPSGDCVPRIVNVYRGAVV